MKVVSNDWLCPVVSVECRYICVCFRMAQNGTSAFSDITGNGVCDLIDSQGIVRVGLSPRQGCVVVCAIHAFM